jgi:FlaA1/EpsC-like NDP-sugar epimerase
MFFARCRSIPFDAARCRSMPFDAARCRSEMSLAFEEVTIMNKHMKVVVIGGSGLIGKKLVNNQLLNSKEC